MEGNQMKMREALERVEKLTREFVAGNYYLTDYPQMLLNTVTTALSAPPRNCDVGTPEEQVQRMTDDFCMKQWKDGLIRCSLCPISCTNGRRTCTLTWAQMPYEAEEGTVK